MRGDLACSLLLSARERVDCRLDETKSRIPSALPFSCCCICPSPAPVQNHMRKFITYIHYLRTGKLFIAEVSKTVGALRGGGGHEFFV
jgi:hypothetical protein